MDDLTGLSWGTPTPQKPMSPANSRNSPMDSLRTAPNGNNGSFGNLGTFSNAGSNIGNNSGSSSFNTLNSSSNSNSLNGGAGSSGLGSSGGAKIKPPVPPVSSKPGYVKNASSAPAPNLSASSSPAFASLTPSLAQPIGARTPMGSSPASRDAFDSLMPTFGKADDLTKSLNGMTLEERKRYDQSQQAKQGLGLGNGYNSNGGSGSSSGVASPSFSHQPLQPTPTRTNNINLGGGFQQQQPASQNVWNDFALNNTKSSNSLGNSNNNRGTQSPLNAFTSSSPGLYNNNAGRSPSPLPSLQPMQPMQPLRPTPSSTSSSSSLDPFGALLGNQVSNRSSPANQSLNTIRSNTPSSMSPAPQMAVADPWDLDFLEAKKPSTSANTIQGSGDDDLFSLGAFEKAPPSQPPTPTVESPPALPRREAQSESRRSPMPTRATKNDQKVAMIVEMGFTVEQAENALALTESGSDLEGAIELLVQNREAEQDLGARQKQRQRQQPSSRSGGARRSMENADGRRTQMQSRSPAWEDDSDPPLTSNRRRNPGQPKSAGQEQQQAQQGEMTRAQQLQQQKDKFVGTASSFGMSVFSKATDLYKTGREKVQAALEDMTGEEGSSGNTGISNSLKRHEWIEDEPGKPKSGGYKDSDSEDDNPRSRQQQNQQRKPAKPARHHGQEDTRGFRDQDIEYRKPVVAQQDNSRRDRTKETFENTYVSSSRRGAAPAASRNSPVPEGSLLSTSPPKRNQQPQQQQQPQRSRPSAASPLPSSGSKAQQQPQKPSTPTPRKPARPPRNLVQASSQQLQESNMFKEKGNEAFKLGQFGQSAELYGRAIQVLPHGHLLLAIVHNNRAAALLKNGEYRDCIESCEISMKILEGDDGQGLGDELPVSEGGGTGSGAPSVNLKDQMGKSLMRRATAYESLEKYRDAQKDWTRLRELDPSHRNAADGQRRCEKALEVLSGGGSAKLSSSTAARPSAGAASKPKQPSSSSPMQDIFASVQGTQSQAQIKKELDQSVGVSKLRESNLQQEQEEDEKLRLRDQVDNKLTLWKAGKEENLRALISSLGTILWPGAEWKVVGLHELVTPSQVKIKYIRAIAKVHPDKLGASTTVEQRMLANTIFSTLNTAWDHFKTQNNM